MSGGRRGRRHVLYRIAVMMCMLVELQDVFHQLFLCLVDVEYGDAGELELVAVSRQHDGFPLSGEEESVVLHINLCRDEVVGIHIRGVICQFAEAMERADDCHGDHSLQDCFQSQAGEGVRLYDSYFWLVIHHKSMDS